MGAVHQDLIGKDVVWPQNRTVCIWDFAVLLQDEGQRKS